MCMNNCYNNGTSSAKTKYDSLEKCATNNCSMSSNPQQCVQSNCSTELNACVGSSGP